MKRRDFTAALICASAGVLSGKADAAEKKPNIIYMIVHDLGKHCSPYGVPVETPNLEAFSRQGLTFNNAFCASPPCSPSRAAAMSGTYSHQAGVVGLSHLGFTASDSFVHVTEYLQKAGYETVLAGLQHELHHEDAQRLLHYDRKLARGGELNVFVDKAVEDAIEYLETRKDSDRPFFLNIGTQEVHLSMWDGEYEKKYNRLATYGGEDPREKVYIPPELPRNETSYRMMSRFQPCIRYMDYHFGRLMQAVDRLGLAENTVVIFTTDHGITATRGKGTVYDLGMEISLMVRWPAVIQAGRRENCLINNIDVFPTLLELAGANIPSRNCGKSFLPLLTGEPYQKHEMIFMERNYHNNYDPMRSVRTEKYHYILNLDPQARHYYTAPEIEQLENKKNRDAWPNSRIWMVNSDHPSMANWPLRAKEELYDIEKDPNEFVNLAGNPEYKPVLEQLANRCREWMKETDDPLLKGDIPPTAAMQKMLEKRNVKSN